MSALAVGPDGDLYAAGSFTTIGGIPAQGVARWDGAAWHKLGTGLDRSTSDYIDAFAFGPDGDVYAAGFLHRIGDVAVRDVARWDGTAWSAIGDGSPPGFLNEVYSVAVGPDGTLYVGGRDYNQDRPCLYAWDGTEWQPVGGGIVGNVWSLEIGPDGALYAGGEYMSPIGAPYQDGAVMRWDGAAWTTVGVAAEYGSGPPVYDLAVAPNGDLYAGGYFRSMDGVPSRNVARFDGMAWSAVGDPDLYEVSEVYAVAVGLDGSLYVGGSAEGGVARWNGLAWSVSEVTDSAFRPYIGSLALDPSGDIFVGGGFETIGGAEASSLARFSPFPTAEAPQPERLGALAIAPNPARGASAITLTHAGGPLAVEIVDALGRRVGAVSVEAPVGTQTVALPVAGLPAGVYVVRVSAGGTVEARTVTILR